MPERHDPPLIYVNNKYSKARFNCVHVKRFPELLSSDMQGAKIGRSV